MNRLSAISGPRDSELYLVDGEWTCERQVQGQLYPEVSCIFQKPVLATWIPDMLVLPLDFKLSLTHWHITAFISEEWWEACGW